MGAGGKHAAKKRVQSPPQLLLLVVSCGFCTGVLLGCLYYKTRMQQDGSAFQATSGRAATTSQLAGVAAIKFQNAGKLRRRTFRVIRHNFTQAKLLEEAAVAGFHTSPPAVSAATPQPDPSQAALAGGAGGWQQSAGSKPVPLPGDTIHSLYTSNGSPYQNFQGRIMYASFRLVQKMPGGERMTGFTRILHRTKDDEVVGEIPTFRANPLQPACDNWCEFPVSDRPNAVAQWLRAVKQDPSLLKGAWILMLETDYVWQKPLMAPGSAYDLSIPGEAFLYHYIDPAYPSVVPIIRKMCPTCDPKHTPRSGPAPVLMRLQDWTRAVPDWERLAAWIEASKEAKDTLGWLREMYAWDLSVQINNISLVHRAPPDSPLLAQPPADHVIGNACLYHYTWGAIFKDQNGTEVWKFDKRFYTSRDDALKVPLLPLPPTPWREGAWKLQDGVAVTRELHQIMTDEVKQMNAAIRTLPDLRRAARSAL